MRYYPVAVIGGDGIGPEVIAAALPVLHASGELFDFRLETTSFMWGCEYYVEHGAMMPLDGLKQLEVFQAIFLGAIGFPSLVPDHISPPWPAARNPARLSAVRQHAAAPVASRRTQSAALGHLRHPVHSREQRGRVCRRRRPGTYGHTRRSRGRDCDLHPAWLRAGDALRLRDRAQSQGNRSPATKSNALQHSMASGTTLLAGGRRLSYVDASSSFVHALGARSARVPIPPRGGRLKPLRRHPHRLRPAIHGGLASAGSANLHPTRAHPSMFERSTARPRTSPVRARQPERHDLGWSDYVAPPRGRKDAATWSAALGLCVTGTVGRSERRTWRLQQHAGDGGGGDPGTA